MDLGANRLVLEGQLVDSDEVVLVVRYVDVMGRSSLVREIAIVNSDEVIATLIDLGLIVAITRTLVLSGRNVSSHAALCEVDPELAWMSLNVGFFPPSRYATWPSLA